MAMTEDEYADAYFQLARPLRENGLGWVVDQVDARVQLREPMEEAIQTVRVRSYATQASPGLTVQPSQPQRRTDTFVVTREYTALEQLIFLLDAIEQATVDVADMQESTVRLMNDLGVNAIAFYADDPNDQGSELTREQAVDHRQQAQVLRDALNKLRGAMDAS